MFHNKRHPIEMSTVEIEVFLSYLANERNVSSSTQNQALSAILFLYRDVLKIDLSWVKEFTRSKVPKRLPVVLSPIEIKRFLIHARNVPAPYGLILQLLYGTGCV
jgi:integrase